jgi:ribosome maturation factor RimP
VDVDECAKISNELSVVLEAHELVGENYVLNVSSPGLDRPLKDIRQFRKNVGRKVSVSYNSDEGPKTIPGTFTNFNDEVLTVEKENGEPVEISYSTVTHAKVFPAW